MVLAGHSYADTAIREVADRAPERIVRLIYVNTWPLPAGVAQLDLNSLEARQAQEQKVATQGEGWRFPLHHGMSWTRATSFGGLGETERRLMRERAVDQPFGTVTQAFKLNTPSERLYRRPGSGAA